MEIREDILNIAIKSVVNIEEIKSSLNLNLAKYKNIIWTEETRPEIQELIKELKPERTKIKKVAAEFKKQGTAKVKSRYDEIKGIEALLDEVINPLEQGEKDYLEQCRIRKLEYKKGEFFEIINLLNNTIEAINEEIKYLDIPLVEFQDSWGNDSIKTIQIKIDTIQDEATRTRQNALDRIDLVNTHCELLKNTYNLTTAPNGQLILGKDIHELDNLAIKEKLDDFAMDQQEKEIEAAERAEAAEKRKGELEAERVKAEAEAKLQFELKAVEDKARREERLKLLDEIKPEPIVEPIKQEIEQKIEQHNENPIKTQTKTLYFPELTKQQANDMCKYFNEHNIKFKAIK